MKLTLSVGWWFPLRELGTVTLFVDSFAILIGLTGFEFHGFVANGAERDEGRKWPSHLSAICLQVQKREESLAKRYRFASGRYGVCGMVRTADSCQTSCLVGTFKESGLCEARSQRLSHLPHM